MTDEPKRRSYAIDDVETISRRMKEIAAEREATLNPNPLDGERSMAPLTLQEVVDAALSPSSTAALIAAVTEANTLGGYFKGKENPKPDSLEFWQPLIDAGILEVGEA